MPLPRTDNTTPSPTFPPQMVVVGSKKRKLHPDTDIMRAAPPPPLPNLRASFAQDMKGLEERRDNAQEQMAEARAASPKIKRDVLWAHRMCDDRPPPPLERVRKVAGPGPGATMQAFVVGMIGKDAIERLVCIEVTNIDGLQSLTAMTANRYLSYKTIKPLADALAANCFYIAINGVYLCGATNRCGWQPPFPQ